MRLRGRPEQEDRIMAQNWDQGGERMGRGGEDKVTHPTHTWQTIARFVGGAL